jgi:hypothetical protein
MTYIPPAILVPAAGNAAKNEAPAVAAGISNVTSGVTDAVSSVTKPALYFANAWVTLSVAGVLFVIGMALIFSRQLASVLGTGASVAGPGKIATAAKVAQAVKA